MTEFTPLEHGILDAICHHMQVSVPSLRKALNTAVVFERDNTGHGFYTKFEVAKSDNNHWPRMIDGPSARMIDLGEDNVMGFILWCSERGPTTLEGFQYGDSAGRTVDLRTLDLSRLRFSELAFCKAAPSVL